MVSKCSTTQALNAFSSDVDLLISGMHRRLRDLEAEATQIQEAFFSATRMAATRHRGGVRGKNIPVSDRARLTVAVHLDGRGRNSLTIRWMQVSDWQGWLDRKQGRWRPSYRNTRMNKDHTHNLAHLRTLTAAWHWPLVEETEQLLAPMRREARLLGNLTMRLATCGRDLDRLTRLLSSSK